MTDHINLEPTPPLQGSPIQKALYLIGGLLLAPACTVALVVLVLLLKKL